MPDSTKKLETIFDAARNLTSDERSAFLAAECQDNAELRAGVDRLLQAHDAAKSKFLDAPKIEFDETDASSSAILGSAIGPYKLLQKIGEGGMGIVYMAEQTEPVRRKVALKVVKPGMDTKQVIARFEAERQALAMMDHSNIARVFDAGATAQGRPYFVMELVRGVPITEYCDSEKLSTRERLELFVPICQAVHHAHQKGIIHRDLKPTNVMVTLHDGQPVPKVIDFGIAKAMKDRLTAKTLFTEYSQFIGTPLYMSPEQAEMSGLDVDTRTDIYSLGVLLYELLTGTTPFDKTRLQTAAFDEVRRIIREEEPLRPSQKISTLGESLPSISDQRRIEAQRLGSVVRGDLDWIVMKSLEKNRSRRYESASEFAQDVRRHLNDEPVAAGPPTVLYWAKKFYRRNRTIVTTIAAALGLILLSLAFVSVQYFRAERAERKLRIASEELQRNVGKVESAYNASRQAERRLSEANATVNRELQKSEGMRIATEANIVAQKTRDLGSVLPLAVSALKLDSSVFTKRAILEAMAKTSPAKRLPGVKYAEPWVFVRSDNSVVTVEHDTIKVNRRGTLIHEFQLPLIENIAIDPLQQLVAVVAESEGGNASALFLCHLSGEKAGTFSLLGAVPNETNLEFDPTGRKILTHSVKPADICLWDVASAQQETLIENVWFKGARFTQDGSKLVTVSIDHPADPELAAAVRINLAKASAQVRVWNLAGNQPMLPASLPDVTGCHFRVPIWFSRDGESIALVSKRGKSALIELRGSNGDQSMELPSLGFPGESQQVGSSLIIEPVFRRDMNGWIAAIGPVVVCNFDDDNQIRHLAIGSRDRPVTCANVSPNGRLLAVAFKDQQVEVWDLESEERAASTHMPNLKLRAVSINDSGEVAVVAGGDLRDWVYTWRCFDRGLIPATTYATVEDFIEIDEARLAILTRFKHEQKPDNVAIEIVDAQSLEVAKRIPLCHDDGNYILSWPMDRLLTYDSKSKQIVTRISGLHEDVVTISESGSIVDKQTKTDFFSYESDSIYVTSPDRRLLAGSDGQLEIVDVEFKTVWKGEHQNVGFFFSDTFFLSPLKDTFALVADRKSRRKPAPIEVHNAASGELLCKIKLPRSRDLQDATFSHDSQLLFTVGKKNLAIWRLPDGHQVGVQSIEELPRNFNKRDVELIRLTPDDSRLVAIDGRGQGIIWKVKRDSEASVRLELERSLPLYAGKIQADVDFSNDGRLLALAGETEEDARAVVWDIEKGERVLLIPDTDPEPFVSVQFVANDTMLATRLHSNERTLQLWPLDPTEVLKACGE